MSTHTAQRTAAITCCGCTQQCGLLAEVEDGRVVDLRGDRAHPLSTGYICPKGKDATELVYHPDRILHPLRRVGPRGSGQWEPVAWDEALDDIAARIADLTRRDGARALAYSYGTFRGGDWGIGERFLNRHGSPNSCGQDKTATARWRLRRRSLTAQARRCLPRPWPVRRNASSSGACVPRRRHPCCGGQSALRRRPARR